MNEPESPRKANMKQKQKKTWLKLVADKFLSSALNKTGLALVILMACTAVFAPLIANDKPYYYVDDGTWTFPALGDFPLIGEHFSYPQYRETEFRKLATQPGARLLLPPIPYSPTEYDLDNALSRPTDAHLMGTDDQGRDIASRMIYGARISLAVGFVAVAIYASLGIVIGSIAGFFGGWVDLAISRVIEIVMCFPTFFLILAVLAFVGPSVFNIMIVIGLTGWTGIARLVRGEFLKLKNLDFVQSARALGYSFPRIIFRHILPNALSPVLVSVTFGIASAILVESSLSFLGFGVQPPTPSWGDILSQSREFMDIAWWLMFYPGVAIFITVTAFNLVGEGLQDAIDPRT